MKLLEISKKIILIIGVALIAIIFCRLFFVSGSDAVLIVLVYFSFLLVAAALVVLVRALKPKSIFVCIALIAITAACVLVFKSSRPDILGETDLKFYYSNAVSMVENNFSHPTLYTATFPGTITYPALLAVLMKIFGVNRMVPVMLNVFMICAASCSAYLFLRTKMADTWAVSGALLIAVNPMLIIYAATCNAEILFCGAVLLSFFSYVRAMETDKRTKKLKWVIISACLCGFSSIFRPLSIIFAIALVMWTVIFRPDPPAEKIIHSAVICAAFILFSFINSAIVKSVTTYDYPSSSYGWNLYVGASESGRWNEEDASEFNEILSSADTPSEIHEYFTEKAWERYSEMGIGIIEHSLKKLSPWLPYDYIANEAFRYEGSENDNIDATINVYKTIVMIYDLPILALALLGCIYIMIKSFRRGSSEQSGALILVLYLIGSILTLMIIEIAPRYTVAYRMVFSVLAIYSLHSVYNAHKLRLQHKANNSS